MKKTIATLILIFNLNYIGADDYVWGEEFKEGDVISAATFNQIFDTLQKLNRTPVDADLLGTWSCSSVRSYYTGMDTTGWVRTGFIDLLSNAQLTMTASSAAKSLESAYSFSTSNPTPLISFDDASYASSGTYMLYRSTLFFKGLSTPSGNSTSVIKHQVNIVSDDRFTLTPLSGGGNSPDMIVCDSAISVPAAPTSITATNAQTSVNVTWTDQSSDETGFKIYRRLSSETEAKEIATAVLASPYSDSTLTEGQEAYYSVTAYNDNGESVKSKVVTATLDSIKPTVVSTFPVNEGSTTGTTVSITFSEEVVLNQAILATLVGENNTYYIVHPDNRGISFSAQPIVDGANPSYTVTINSDNVYDPNGNKMAADYVFTFTDN